MSAAQGGGAADSAAPAGAGWRGWRWEALPFDDLGVHRLYALMNLRQRVFSVEQDCVYMDADGTDPACWHLMGWDAAGELRACLRIVPPGLKYPEASIGRVATHPGDRGGGAGLELVRRGIEVCTRLHAGHGIRISAQAHLARFYGRFGFTAHGETYLEDDIPHVEMARPRESGAPNLLQRGDDGAAA